MSSDEILYLDPRAALAAALVDASVGYSDDRVRAMAWLAVATPALYERLAAVLRETALRQSPGAARTLRDAIRALSLEEYMRQRVAGSGERKS